MSDYEKILKYLYDLQLFGIKLGLQNIEALLRYLGNPEDHFPSIHIAGTNGKGSTASMIASILTASGYRTGLYTSPHLVDFSERIRIDGKKIPTDNIVQYTKQLKPVIDKNRATYFEATTAMAFQYFADQNVDIAIIETGLGGRWDATNVIAPILSIITNIGFDHMEYLGNSISSIALEKGGIIKPFIPCLTGTREPDAMKCLAQSAKTNQSKLIMMNRIVPVKIKKRTFDGLTLDLKTANSRYNDLFVSLAGDHQAENAWLSISAVEYIRHVEGFSKITLERIRAGLREVQIYSGLRGRLDILSRSPLIIADVAHNPAGIEKFVIAVKKLLVGRCTLLFGVMKDKACGEMINILKPLARIAVAVTPKTDRALDSRILVDVLQKRAILSFNGVNVQGGTEIAIREKRTNEPIIVIGSHYLVGEVLKLLKIPI